MDPGFTIYWTEWVADQLSGGAEIPDAYLPLVPLAEEINEERRRRLEGSALHAKGVSPMSPSTDTMPPETLRAPGRLELSGPLGLAAGVPTAQGGPRQYRARLITAGTIRAQGNRPSNLEIPASTLQAALDAHLFDGRPAFVDHPSWLDDYPSLRNLAGVVTDCAWDPFENGVAGTITLYPTDAGRIIGQLFDQVLADTAAGRPAPDIGLSAVLWCRWERRVLSDEKGIEADGDAWHMAEIQHVESVDFVFEPGADGRVQAALTALRALPPELHRPPDAVAQDKRDGPEGGASGGTTCLLYTSPSPRDRTRSRMPSSA